MLGISLQLLQGLLCDGLIFLPALVVHVLDGLRNFRCHRSIITYQQIDGRTPRTDSPAGIQTRSDTEPQVGYVHLLALQVCLFQQRLQSY